MKLQEASRKDVKTSEVKEKTSKKGNCSCSYTVLSSCSFPPSSLPSFFFNILPASDVKPAPIKGGKLGGKDQQSSTQEVLEALSKPVSELWSPKFSLSLLFVVQDKSNMRFGRCNI